jgi:hypothetical protein
MKSTKKKATIAVTIMAGYVISQASSISNAGTFFTLSFTVFPSIADKGLGVNHVSL